MTRYGSKEATKQDIRNYLLNTPELYPDKWGNFKWIGNDKERFKLEKDRFRNQLKDGDKWITGWSIRYDTIRIINMPDGPILTAGLDKQIVISRQGVHPFRQMQW